MAANRIVARLHVNTVGHEHENDWGPMSIAAFSLKLYAKIVIKAMSHSSGTNDNGEL